MPFFFDSAPGREGQIVKWIPKDRYQWHDWFAWYPVWVGGETKVWLEVVRRRRASYDSWWYELK